jgi:ATP-binding cassette subfamily B protein
MDIFAGRLRTFGRLARLIWSVQPLAATLLLALTAGAGLFALAELQLLRRLIDTAQAVVQHQAPLTDGLLLGAALAGLAILEGVLGGSSGGGLKLVLSSWFQGKLVAAIEQRCFRQVQAMPLERLEVAEHHDQLQRARQGMAGRLSMTMAFLWNTTTEVVTLGSLLVYLGGFHPLLPLLLALGTTPGALIRLHLGRRRCLIERRQTADERRLNAYINLLIGRDAATEVRLFGFGGWMIDHAMHLWWRLRDERLAYAASDAWLSGLGFGLITLAYVGTIALSVWLFATGHIGLGLTAALFYAIERFQTSYQVLSYGLTSIYADLPYVQDYFAFTDGPRLDQQAGLPLAGPLRREIRFEDVSFAYPGSAEPALRNLSLTIHPGERLALVGENGAGKTTLVKLLLGLYRPTAGRILVDGVDLSEIAPEDWYGRIGAVFQNFIRFQATIGENIGAGWIDQADDTAIAAAAVRSGAQEVATALPHGLATLLGKEFHDGVDLSLGQWQKLAIARAYLRPAELLILDEPTSALDAKAEADVYAHFAALAQARTVLLISHRLGSCRFADRILVLERGRLVEEGAHAALLAANGRYAELYRMQAAWYQ